MTCSWPFYPRSGNQGGQLITLTAKRKKWRTLTVTDGGILIFAFPLLFRIIFDLAQLCFIFSISWTVCFWVISFLLSKNRIFIILSYLKITFFFFFSMSPFFIPLKLWLFLHPWFTLLCFPIFSSSFPHKETSLSFSFSLLYSFI